MAPRIVGRAFSAKSVAVVKVKREGYIGISKLEGTSSSSSRQKIDLISKEWCLLVCFALILVVDPNLS